MSVDIEALKRIALAATPGPWEWHGDSTMLTASIEGDIQQVLWTANAVTDDQSHLGNDCRGPDGRVLTSLRLGACGDRTEADADANHAFMAAANPAAVLELIRRLETAEKIRSTGWIVDLRLWQQRIKAIRDFADREDMMRFLLKVDQAAADTMQPSIGGI